MLRMTFLAAMCGAAVLLCVPAAGETLQVSDIDTLVDILENKAEPGDVVEIAPGAYMMNRPTIYVRRSGTPENPIVIRGVVVDGRRPVIDGSPRNIKAGIFYFELGIHDIIVENLEICNARGTGRAGEDQPNNAAAAYIRGKNITFRNCYSHHNQDGFFSNRMSDYVLIDRCEIAFNGRYLGVDRRYRTHGFYFNSIHQMVINSYIHNQTDAENFKSRGGNTIFAYNRVEEEGAYSMGVDSNGRLGTLWLGNLIRKRTVPGCFQGRLFAVGDGTGVASGKLVAINNTFVTVFPRDYYLFTFETTTTDIVFVNNVFAGPGEVFMHRHGKGSITGFNNWIQAGMQYVPDTLEGAIRGNDPGFVDAEAGDFRLKAGSPLLDAGCSREKFAEAVRTVLANARTGSDTAPSPEYLAALERVEGDVPLYEPVRRGGAMRKRDVTGALDIGAFESAAPASEPIVTRDSPRSDDGNLNTGAHEQTR